MKYWFTPESFHLAASSLSPLRWRLLAWSLFAFILFLMLQAQIKFATPNFLVWVALFILFSALQALVLASFIFFFQILPSDSARTRYWFRLYRVIEWCETLLFALLLPLPTLSFIYAVLSVNGITLF
ncbi:hypothetical protein [Thalassomonas actiniarum]|uniref:Uncharacterized protein n=1 Tax=Thalassomonas actiniarum TaxID=485447 RepID=A0AAE9YU32_9GAMM|nr:hypothetical protein [Thalassomonas actiniarum]WDE01226.1 hypothetical protein SG35_011610 [Thalassomonas actiniarum]